MDHIGIDVHKKERQICILAEGGERIEQRIRTEPERFAAVFGGRPRARILIEASTNSEWVARCLEGLGQEVIVADPNFAPMYATRARKVKTDRRDARVQRLRTVPSIGPITAATFVATLDDAQRFRHAHQVEAYLGLVPREFSSGESQRRGPMSVDVSFYAPRGDDQVAGLRLDDEGPQPDARRVAGGHREGDVQLSEHRLRVGYAEEVEAGLFRLAARPPEAAERLREEDNAEPRAGPRDITRRRPSSPSRPRPPRGDRAGYP
jgi:transposase